LSHASGSAFVVGSWAGVVGLNGSDFAAGVGPTGCSLAAAGDAAPGGAAGDGGCGRSVDRGRTDDRASSVGATPINHLPTARQTFQRLRTIAAFPRNQNNSGPAAPFFLLPERLVAFLPGFLPCAATSAGSLPASVASDAGAPAAPLRRSISARSALRANSQGEGAIPWVVGHNQSTPLRPARSRSGTYDFDEVNNLATRPTTPLAP
jgi:hypothetical protein